MAFLQRSLLWLICLAALFVAIDGAIQLGLVSSMVSFIHSSARTPVLVAPPGQQVWAIGSFPENLVTDPGHVANAAGGTALVLVGFGSVIALSLEKRSRKKRNTSSPVFYLWCLIVLLSFLLTLGALIYAFVETANTSGQTIDEAVARANPPPAKYPLGRWTPETWGNALLELPLASPVQRRRIHGKVNSMPARLRRTFHYPSSDDDDDASTPSTPEFLDEQEQESLISTLTAQNHARNASHARLLFLLPALSTIPFLLRLCFLTPKDTRSTSPLFLLPLLGLSSLLATTWLLARLEPTETGFAILDAKFRSGNTATTTSTAAAITAQGGAVARGRGLGLGWDAQQIPA
ncbi:hypothetical protein VTJ49DRAFT_2799 [Mycothermus thermophilus]|uniref:Uncharacterized protein n=1 Tax=Humicola insolens TaxID=85995 RepID=A0ABR3VB05_HUMIN